MAQVVATIVAVAVVADVPTGEAVTVPGKRQHSVSRGAVRGDSNTRGDSAGQCAGGRRNSYLEPLTPSV